MGLKLSLRANCVQLDTSTAASGAELTGDRSSWSHYDALMSSILHPWQRLLVGGAGWISRQQLDVIAYLKEENRILREQMGKRRFRFTDDQRRSPAAKAKHLGCKALRELATIVTPDTLLRWHRQLIARKYDGSGHRGPGRPGVMQRDPHALA